MSGLRVTRVNGSLVEATPASGIALYELTYVGEARLLAEVIGLVGDVAILQVYEDTNGLAVGEPVAATGGTLQAELGPGLLGSILDGLGRPLDVLASQAGPFVPPGRELRMLDAARRWHFVPALAPGDRVSGGDVLGSVEERPGFAHRVLVPPGVEGTLVTLDRAELTVDQPVGKLEDGTPLRLAHRWPVRRPRPVGARLPLGRPFLTGQRILDLLFPVAEGGTVAVPGGFGTGKTVIEQSLAKHGEADVVVYIGCGERGNEMAEVLSEFPRLADPRTGRSIMDRTVMVVNTSNMPVAAREASVYLGVTIAEYFRDQGLRVALMADSLSRWAEALREIGARLQEMPGEEGYPTYLASRLAKFYERAGRVKAAGRPEREGALTLISAVSPPGGDLSEPVSQASLRVAGTLWALDADLAHQRQFPAVDWATSYSLHAEQTTPWFAASVDARWAGVRARTLELLQRDRELREIAGLVGPEALQDADRLVLAVAQLLREVVLGQSAYHPNDAHSSPEKTFQLASLACAAADRVLGRLQAGVALSELDLGPLHRALVALRDGAQDELQVRAAAATAELDRLSARGAAA
ncbi:MAG TPA: V-type ATP synthase subunit A [Myxococcaceae bacterium]|nr:V-type ATP synthase subunit A [Myxococcaceae bacterium]